MAEENAIGWAILELMGHRKLGGFVREVELAGGKFLRIDVPGPGVITIEGDEPDVARTNGQNPSGPWQASQFYAPGAVYCITPCAAAVAIQFAKSCRVEPVTRWELPQLPEKPSPRSGIEAFDDAVAATYDDDDEDENGLSNDDIADYDQRY